MSTCVNLLTDQVGTCQGSLHIGRMSYSYYDRSTAIGVGAGATTTGATAIGSHSSAAMDSTAVGRSATTCFRNTVVVGSAAVSYGNNSTVIGTNARNAGDRNILITAGVPTCYCASLYLNKHDTITLAAGICLGNSPTVKFEISSGCGCYLEFTFGGTTKRISATDFFTKLGI